MDKTQKSIMYVTTILLAIIIMLFFGKIFMFEKGKEKTSGEVNVNLINSLYSYLPEINYYQMDSVYSKYSSFDNINIGIIEIMIINFLNNNSKDRLEKINDTDLIDMGIDFNQVDLLYKISKENLNYGLKMVFGDNKNATFKDVYIDEQTRGKYYNETLYVYKVFDGNPSEFVVYRKINKYTIGDDQTIKINDYYLVCNKIDGICYNDDKKTNVNSNITYSNGIVFDNYKDNMKQYEHTFKYNNGNYYWLSSKAL